ncbi:MAG: hypothetical protein GWM92_15745 [Gemmatimonadetes bacterium]|nr:hypothetical protein [Gemmatimonadota bacterium]NIR80185.1 hypothetical protein [Gemmatimonadota bacterium]NIT88947.1 hypothetical protein [Gemmatimonadota bacterium]NIU32742.1 hypothetical protein [Gemmatimonadota bacterium]NIU37174.1 hypothetical protein [Gemmatimonadota bacterium]
MPRKGFRTQTAPDFVEARRKEEPIKARNLVSYHLLRTQYDWDVTGGTGAGDVLSDAAYRVAREITIQAGGRPLHHFRGHTMGKIVALFFPEEFAQTDPSDDAAGINETGRESIIPIPYYMPWAFLQDEFALPTRDADARILVDWAAAAELVDGEDGAPVIQNVTTELLEAALFGVELPNGQTPPSEFWGAVSLRHTVKAVTQDGTITVDLKWLENGQELRLVMVEGMAKGANNDEYLHDDLVVEKVGPLDIDGVEEFEEVDSGPLQNRNKVEYERSALETGVYVLDAAEDKRTQRGDIWLVRGEEKPTLDLQVSKQANDTRVVVTTLAVTRGQRERILRGARQARAAQATGRARRRSA